MAGTSMPSSLRERLRQRHEEDARRIAAERKRYEGLIESEFAALGQSARESAAGALRTIESDLAAGTGRASALVRKAWARTLATAISLLLGISIGSWGLGQWLSYRVRTLVELEAQIEEREQTLELLEEKTWGLDLREAGNGKYVVLPEGVLTLDGRDRPQKAEWTVGGQPAIKLSLP